MRHTLLALGLWVAGCGSPYLVASRPYVEQGSSALAVEVLARGLADDPKNPELKEALVAAEQRHQYELRDELDRLVGSERYLAALARLVVLEDSARHLAPLGVPGEDPAALGRERADLEKRALTSLQVEQDSRTDRNADVRNDVNACYQLLAMLEKDDAVARQCERLRSRFRLSVVLEPAPASTPLAGGILAGIDGETRRRHPRLFEVVDRAANSNNGVLRVFVGAPRTSETGFVQVGRDAFHTWVAKVDKKGKQLEEEVTEQPSKDEIEKAKKDGKPAPKAKKVKKKVWEEVRGEVRRYKNARVVRVPVRVVVESLTDDTLAFELEREQLATSASEYHEYTGDPRARAEHQPKTPEGRASAPALKGEAELVSTALASLPTEIVATILEKVER
jgi:hypothetical protein